MTRLFLCLTLSLVSSPDAIRAQIPDSAITPTGGHSSQVFFLRSPIPLAWSAIAQMARPDFQPAHPDTNLIRDNYDERDEGSWIAFEAPLPPSLPTRHYWVLADSGAGEVHPRIVVGMIAIATDPAGWPVTKLTYDGHLEAPRPAGQRLGESSFTLFSRLPVRIRSSSASIASTAVHPTVLATLGSRRIEVKLDSTHRVPSLARVFDIVQTGQVFLLVRWPNGDICAGDSRLYDITSGVPRFVAVSRGHCTD